MRNTKFITSGHIINGWVFLMKGSGDNKEEMNVVI